MENTDVKNLGVTTCSRYSEIFLQHWWLGYLCIFTNVLLLIVTILENVLILIALSNVSVLHPPSKLLLRNLAAADLSVGLITQPLFIAYLLSIVAENGTNACEIVVFFLLISTSILCGISLCTLTMISVERLLALMLGLQYRQVITRSRVKAVVVFIWFVFISVNLLYFWNPRVFATIVLLNVPTFLLVSTISYTKIYFTLRRRQLQIRQGSASSQFDEHDRARYLKYRRTVTNAMWVSVCVVAFYLPSAIFTAVRRIKVYDDYFSVLTEVIVVNLIYLNSAINPLVYCWRITQARRSVKATIRNFCTFFAHFLFI
ncbi:melanocortin receptor 4-like [Acropora millepora]|uniref:melanocortin receptor 4-like n=1 Tax=Acropora millepora TaxID=45264 RepID=UPI001CF52D8E|nr:melanocortin receptor 4-like [Acropora millepora]